MEDKQKVYIKGNAERGDEVIKLLKDLGGRDSYSLYDDGTNENIYYFIGPDGEICGVSKEEHTLYSFIKEFYKEIKLERWKPKNEDCYYYLDDRLRIIKSIVNCWYGEDADNSRYELGNCFKTPEEAEVASNKIKEVLNNR